MKKKVLLDESGNSFVRVGDKRSMPKAVRDLMVTVVKIDTENEEVRVRYPSGEMYVVSAKRIEAKWVEIEQRGFELIRGSKLGDFLERKGHLPSEELSPVNETYLVYNGDRSPAKVGDVTSLTLSPGLNTVGTIVKIDTEKREVTVSRCNGELLTVNAPQIAAQWVKSEVRKQVRRSTDFKVNGMVDFYRTFPEAITLTFSTPEEADAFETFLKEMKDV